MGNTNGMKRTRNDGLTYGLFIENRKIVVEINNNLFGYTARFDVANITNEKALRAVFEGLFGGDWR